jgi:hypothetical protein
MIPDPWNDATVACPVSGWGRPVSGRPFDALSGRE